MESQNDRKEILEEKGEAVRAAKLREQDSLIVFLERNFARRGRNQDV